MRLPFFILAALITSSACGPAPAQVPPQSKYGSELVGPPPKELSLRTPEAWAECGGLKEKAATAAGLCNAEIQRGCDGADEIRQLGECPECDKLDKLNEELKQKECWVSIKDIYSARVCRSTGRSSHGV